MTQLRLLGTLFTITLSLLTPFSLVAQSPDTVLLSPIVVTATRYPIPAASAATTVTVLSGAALRAQGIATVADALRLVPGAAVVATGSFGGQTSLFLRGGESDYVKVLIDGVPQNQPGGFYDFASLGTEDVERIEVVRGPVSVLYGSDAVTGVVHVMTRAGGERANARIAFGAGSYGSEWGQASVAGGGTALRYAVNAARHTTDGIYAFNNGYRRDLIGARLQLHPDARTEASIVGRYTEGVFHFPTDFVGVPSDSDQNTSSRGPSLAFELRRTLSQRVTAHLSTAYHREVSRYDDGQDSPGDTSVFCCSHSRDVVRRLVLGARTDVHITAATILSGGIELERQRQDGTTLDTARHNNSAYVQALVGAGRSLSLTFGGRVDENQQFGRHATGRAGLAASLGGLTLARVSIGTGFKEPSFFENFASGFVVGNPDLRPEQSTSWEAGVSRTSLDGRRIVSITYFDQRFRNLIQYSPVPMGADSVNYVNVGSAVARGVELWAYVPVVGRITLSANYTLLQTRDPATGQRLQRRPNHTAGVRVAGHYAREGIIDVTARFTGTRDDQDFSTFPATPVVLPAYTVVDASLQYQVRWPNRMPGIRLTGRVANLFDARYEEVIRFRSPRRTIQVGGEVRVGR